MTAFASGALAGVLLTSALWCVATLLGLALDVEACAGCDRCRAVRR